jgi:hypothetical protein
MKTTATKSATSSSRTASQIARHAHETAEKYIAKHGIPSDIIFVARCCAEYGNYVGADAELFVERMAGHMLNVECGGQGV